MKIQRGISDENQKILFKRFQINVENYIARENRII